MTTQIRERNTVVDTLKAVGILCVVFAHVNPPWYLFDIRTFDVCMLVFASGMTLKYHAGTWTDYFLYIQKRFRRLIVPTWSFILFYYLLSGILCRNNPQWSFSVSDCIQSFTFTGGMGYIWIVRVYFLLAIISPIVVKVSERMANCRSWLLLLIGLFAVNALAVYLTGLINHSFIKKCTQAILVYTTGYSIVQIVARLFTADRQKKVLWASCVGFALLWAASGFASPQTAKYPPDAMYLLYGIAASCFVCILAQKIHISHYPGLNQFIEWLSRNSFSIYLWHIIPVTLINRSTLEGLPFLVKFLIVFITACAATSAEGYIKKHVRCSLSSQQ